MFIKGEIKDWGDGIPRYTNKDLMTPEELYDFALDTICDIEVKRGKAVFLQANPNMLGLPSLVLKIDGELSFVLVEADVAPIMPKLSQSKRIQMLAHAKSYNAKCYYASIDFGSCDPDRFDKSIALRGDGYYANYLGLEPVTNDIPDIDSNEYKEYVASLFAFCYTEKNFNDIYPFIANDCEWFSFFSGNKYSTKKEIIQYYNQKAINMSDSDIYFRLIEFTSDYFTINSKSKVLKRNQVIMVPQPKGEIGILLEQRIDDRSNWLVIALQYNSENKISSIYLGEPNLMKFKNF